MLVEDVGELYPDVSYRLRNRIPDPVETSASNPDVSRTKVRIYETRVLTCCCDVF